MSRGGSEPSCFAPSTCASTRSTSSSLRGKDIYSLFIKRGQGAQHRPNHLECSPPAHGLHPNQPVGHKAQRHVQPELDQGLRCRHSQGPGMPPEGGRILLRGLQCLASFEPGLARSICVLLSCGNGFKALAEAPGKALGSLDFGLLCTCWTKVSSENSLRGLRLVWPNMARDV